MAENKESSLELETELEEMGDLDMELDLNNDVSADMVELKNRMDKADQEMRAMTEAMKSTLLDVRTLMQDMDNPFNMLRDMGVDKLVNVAVETVEDEVNKKKREEAKKRLAGTEEDEKDPIAVAIEGSTTSNPGIPVSPSYQEPIRGVESQARSPVVSEEMPETIRKVASEAPSQGAVSKAQPPVALSPMGSMGGGSAEMSHYEDRMAQNEAALNQIAGTVNELAKAIRESNIRKPSFTLPSLDSLNGASVTSDYYEAYVNLIADYLQIRLGDKGSEEILLEGMYKEWASPKVVRDIMDKLSSSKKQSKKEAAMLVGLSDVEDKMLITSLLRNLDKPVSEWGESTHLFLLLALVSRARESHGNRS